MRNLTIEQQKEFEKLIVEINRLHQENDDLIKSHNQEIKRSNNVNKNLFKEIDKLKKENLVQWKDNSDESK